MSAPYDSPFSRPGLVRVVGFSQPARIPSSREEFLQAVRAVRPPAVREVAWPAAGAAAGAILWWPSHPVLGGLMGLSAGRNLPRLLRPEEQAGALGNVGQMAAAVLGSLLLGSPGQGSKLGFGLGWIAGGLLLHWGGMRR